MAIDSYMFFKPYDKTGGGPLMAESQVTDASFDANDNLAKDLSTYAKAGQLFEVTEYSFDVEQTLNVGSQGSGVGAGKITFNPFSFTRKVDCSTTSFFKMACSGQAFQQVGLAMRRGSGGSTYAGSVFIRFDFKLAAVKTVSWAHDDESPTETVTLDYGALIITYAQQDTSGKQMAPIIGGWNRVTNIADMSATNAIAVKG